MGQLTLQFEQGINLTPTINGIIEWIEHQSIKTSDLAWGLTPKYQWPIFYGVFLKTPGDLYCWCLIGVFMHPWNSSMYICNQQPQPTGLFIALIMSSMRGLFNQRIPSLWSSLWITLVQSLGLKCQFWKLPYHNALDTWRPGVDILSEMTNQSKAWEATVNGWKVWMKYFTDKADWNS